jgi:oligopeptide transport system ATP-binding protein
MTILEVNNLSLAFSQNKTQLPAIRSLSFHLNKGEILGIVGESGCGKSVLVQSLVKLLPSPPLLYIDGEILFEKIDLFKKSAKELMPFRGSKIAYIFQDPMTSLNPTMCIGKQVLEALKKNKSKKAVYSLLKEVGINNPHERFQQYPHELSGGQRQRVMIAIAIASDPKILVADEPTTAIDVTIQAQILALLKKIQKSRNTSIIIISHNLKVVASLADRILVMYAGKIVEEGISEKLLQAPTHPYTKLLLLSVPALFTEKHRLHSIEGSPPDLLYLPSGCSFAERCPYAHRSCFEKDPPLSHINDSQMAACWKLFKTKPLK